MEKLYHLYIDGVNQGEFSQTPREDVQANCGFNGEVKSPLDGDWCYATPRSFLLVRFSGQFYQWIFEPLAPASYFPVQDAVHLYQSQAAQAWEAAGERIEAERASATRKAKSFDNTREVSAPVVEDTDTIAAREIETASDETQACLICGNDDTDCECKTCPACGERTQDGLCSRCGNCTTGTCCECVECVNCDRKIDADDRCSNCERCGRCCPCSDCNACGNRSQYVCGDCECCENCGCLCESHENDGPRVRQKFQVITPKDLTGYKLNPLRRTIGVELELCEVGDHTELANWASSAGAGLVADGSIPDGGCEINTNPMAGDLFLDAMVKMACALENSSANVSRDCGLHVHVDAKDHSQYDLRRLILLWAGVERAMFDIAGKHRIENSTCAPAAFLYVSTLKESEPKAWRKALCQTLYKVADRSIKEEKHEKYNHSRYRSINLHSFFFRKTIEFRLHEATTQDHVFKNWPLVCGQVVQAAFASTEVKIMDILKSSKTSGEILSGILPAKLRSWADSQLKSRYEARRLYGTFETVEAELARMDDARRALISNQMIVLPLTRMRRINTCAELPDGFYQSNPHLS